MDDVQPRLLLVEDDPLVRRSVARALSGYGYDVEGVADAEEALDAAAQQRFDVALIDIGLPDGRSGLDVLRELKRGDSTIECVIFTGDANADVAVDAYDAGAAEFFPKPITDWNRFHHVLRRATRVSQLSRANAEMTSTPSGDILRRYLVGGSAVMEAMRSQIERLAPRGTTVLLRGPTGAGKTRVAHALHAASGRAGAFESISVAGLDGELFNSQMFGHHKGAFTGATDRFLGAFERAAGGTILLDEIGDLHADGQKKLLQVLEERVFQPVGGTHQRMTARVVAATHRDLDVLVREGSFRADLANRLGIRVDVPSLAERLDDIPQLVWLFLKDVNERENLRIRHVTSDVLDKLTTADWSGENLRGLKFAVERMAIFTDGDTLDARQFVAPGAARGPAREDAGELPEGWRDLPFKAFKEAVLSEYVGRYVRSLLDDSGGNVTAAARVADMHAPNFRRLMRRFGIEGVREG